MCHFYKLNSNDCSFTLNARRNINSPKLHRRPLVCTKGFARRTFQENGVASHYVVAAVHRLQLKTEIYI